MRRPFLYVPFAICLSGCAATSDACVTSACNPSGGEPDLAVSEVTMLSTVHDASGVQVVQPEGIDVRIVIRNAGSGASADKPLQIKVGSAAEFLMTLPSMTPGEEKTRTIHVPAPAAGTFLIDTDTTSLVVAIVGLDTNRSNDQRASAPFHLALPALHVTTTLASATLLADAQTSASIRVENVSQYATLPAATVTYCLYDLGGVCNSTFRATSFGAATVPSIPPMSAAVLDHPVVVPNQASNHNVLEVHALGTCVGMNEHSVCLPVADITVRPDYETCNPVELNPGHLTAGVPACTTPCEIVAFSVNAEAGHTYDVQTADGKEETTLRWRTRYRSDPVDVSDAPGFQPSESGKLYLVTAPKYCGDSGIRHEVVLWDTATGAPVRN